MDRKFFVAVKAIVFFDGKFLLVRRSDQARGEHQFWELPGGRLEFGETPEEALLREITEETGLQATLISPIQTWRFFRDMDTQIVGITFLAKTSESRITLSNEHNAYAWVTRDELHQYNIVSSVYYDLLKLDFNAVCEKLDQVRSQS